MDVFCRGFEVGAFIFIAWRLQHFGTFFLLYLCETGIASCFPQRVAGSKYYSIVKRSIIIVHLRMLLTDTSFLGHPVHKIAFL
jgi:hypothetical protein